jgi:hypothetical protein
LYIGRLLVRTMSQGPAIPLSDPELLKAAKDATVYLDTAIRFMQGDENSAGDNQRGLATDIFRLLNAGAKVAPFAHHSGKAFRKEEVMTLENVMRGTSDLGAMCAAVWGVKQIDETLNVVHVQCVKARDFSPCGAFQLIGRPRPGQSYIESEGDFRLHKSPEECGSLADEQPPPPGNRERQQQRSDRVNMVKAWFKEDSNTGIEEMAERFAELGIHVKRDTVVRYREEARKNA